ncbi:Ulp1 family isopeptidase [Candidatus Berkiella aquae]|uniref:Ubiquitin-like protease family profile domain-containing protein n=1 Tax=Candidatus Berkiella aquae TaxID=295108 RepID=A0A0Q9YZB0_9GAMM|nr:Ulp1 family isopeptidase [Candidatus Berkiella aquae]MCS5712694.1 hypothetical protein [Candidatus Berkiella aquae]
MLGEKLTGWLSEVTEQLFFTLGNDSADYMVESPPGEEVLRPVDTASWRGMSMYQENNKMAIYYNGYFPSNDLLESYYNEIQQRDSMYGQEMASRLMEPFQAHKSPERRADWLNSDVINAFFKTLEFSEKIAHLESSYHHAKDFISSLNSSDRTNLRNKLKAANVIFWPYCDDCHWYLLLIERVRGNVFTVKCLDGFNHTQNHPGIIAKGEALLGSIYSHCQIVAQDDVSYLVPQQDNGSDCGTVISYYALRKAQDEDLSVYADYSRYSCNYVQFRLHMAQKLAESMIAPASQRTYLPQSSSPSSSSSSRNKSKTSPVQPASEDKRRSIKSF